MKPEVFWLAATAAMTTLMWLPYILNRVAVLKLGAFHTPLMAAPPVEAEWAQRAKRAHQNAVENLVVFTALVAAAQFAGVSNSATALAGALYFWGRLGHYVVLTLGIPYLRTLIWTVSWIGILIMAWQVLGAPH